MTGMTWEISRAAAAGIQALLNYQKNVHMDYDHSGPDTGAGTTP